MRNWNEPLRRLPRRDAELGGLDLFSRLDVGAAGAALADADRIERVIDEIRAGIIASLANPARVHGWHAQAIFAQVVSALGAIDLLKEEDQGAAWVRSSNPVKPPDYRVVLPDGANLVIEVKNHHSARPERPFRMPQRELDEVVRYGAATHARALVAIFWTPPGLWLLVDPRHFETRGTKAELDLLVAMAENEMAILGDVLLGTLPPLELVIDVQERERTANPAAAGGADVLMVIRKASLAAGGKRLRSKVERRLASYLIWNGRWPETLNHRESNGEITQIRLAFEPEEWLREQGFAFVGWYSELFTNSFLWRTSDGGEITRLTADLDPTAEGFVIPADYESDRLPLWRMHVEPKSGSPNLRRSTSIGAGLDGA